MFRLRIASDPRWVDAVINDFDRFLIDHAAAEKKASGMAMSMISHYPDKQELVKAMIELSIEELIHFKQVVKIMTHRGLSLQPDEKDHYVNDLRKAFRNGKQEYFLDRMVVGAVIEARGCERFALVGDALEPGKLKKFYVTIAESEAKHQDLFIDLAKLYFPEQEVMQRLDQILDIEADILQSLPFKAALH